MKIKTYGRSVTAALAGLLASQSVIAAQPWFQVDIILPMEVVPGQQSIQSGGGWPLVIRATSQKGAPTYSFSEAGDLSDLVTVASDPSGCFDTLVGDPTSSCLQVPPAEIFLRYSVDVDQVGQGDAAGSSSVRAKLVDSAGSGPPMLAGMASDGSATVYEVGPSTGGQIIDGIGYGANDDWPGLVLLANRGVGVVLDEYFNQSQGPSRRNLAGMLNWSTFELSNGKGQSTVSAGTTVPFGLLAPLILADEAVGQPDASGNYVASIKYRVDGGGVTDGPASVRCASTLYPSLAYTTDLELRAFTINGTAPGVLSDGDGDGDVDTTDAELAGYKVISSEAVVHLKLWGDVFGRVKVNADLDGNGAAFNLGVCRPPDLGPGKIKPPPF